MGKKFLLVGPKECKILKVDLVGWRDVRSVVSPFS